MLKLDSLRADLEKERAGTWIESRRWPGVKFLVCALTKPAYQVKRDVLIQRLQRLHKGKTVPSDQLAPHLGKLYAEEIVYGWEGIDVPYSPETALEKLTDPAYRELVAEIEYCAGIAGEVDVEFVDDLLGKSAKVSAPSSKTGAKNETSSST